MTALAGRVAFFNSGADGKKSALRLPESSIEGNFLRKGLPNGTWLV